MGGEPTMMMWNGVENLPRGEMRLAQPPRSGSTAVGRDLTAAGGDGLRGCEVPDKDAMRAVCSCSIQLKLAGG
jgi:hypothetical protein